ncbi:hypothetical protein K2173_008343 [Erythroxylum novogranatense]|uniref:GDSL esterase/lipase n=1 Tax=Erythroxylum novogranatense TaxID=1862640 RepID=A0AAV8TKX6_9ROSI|nr:hypothetical protein K2173_008343 [Erythroxylum novogranatense]
MKIIGNAFQGSFSSKKHYRRRSVALVFASLVFLLMSVIGATHVRRGLPSQATALYVMGDSSVDCGENTLGYPFLRRNFSLSPCDNGSDTTLLPHFLAKKMNLPKIPSFYNQNGSIEGLKQGLNYGSAIATIIKVGSLSHQSLNQQLRQVFETIQLLQLHLGEEESQHFVKSSIFYLSFGKYDYVNLFLGNSSGLMLGFSGQEFANILVNQIVRAIKNLYNADVRKMIVMGIMPLGCMPHVVWEWTKTESENDGEARGCVEEINVLALQYNTMLHERILDLNTELPDAHITFCDVYHGTLEIMSNAARYGFKDVKNPCCGLHTQDAIVGCLSIEMACNQSSGHVWWDSYNPTEAVNSLLANSAWSGYICSPISVQDMVYT